MSVHTVEYIVRVHEEDDATFWAEVLDLPGCFASGDTLDELREALQEAIALYLIDDPEAATIHSYPFTGFKSGASTTTDSTGHYAFKVTPGLNTRFRANAATKPGPSTTPTEILELVRTRLTFGLSTYRPRRGQLVRFSGSVYPAHDGGLVAIQRRLSTGAYSTITRVRLAHVIGANRSSYSKRLRVYRTGTFRVVLGSHADHARAVSSARTARVG